MKPQRPGVLLWLWYAMGGSLPSRYRAWVLHDASCKTWVPRHFIRAFLQISVIMLPILPLIPGPGWVRLTALLLGLLVGLQYALWFMDGAVERRVQRAGYSLEELQAAREALRAEERAAAEARYAARYRRPNNAQ